MPKILIGVIGDSETTNPKELEFAEKLGKALAKKGYVIISGGRGGIMEAVAKGAKKGGGITVGILPWTSKKDANPYTDIVIPTGLGWARNSIVPLAADVVVAIGGKAGTLSELAFAWLYDKPIICVKGFGGWSEILAGKKIDDRRDDIIYAASSVDEVLQIIEQIIDSYPREEK